VTKGDIVICGCCAAPFVQPRNRPSLFCSRGCGAKHAMQVRYSGPRMFEHFWDFVDKSGDCWLWTAACNPHGYAQVMIDGSPKRVHRLAWESVNGAIPSGMQVLHHCDNPPCVRAESDPSISHLFLGTVRDNSHDALRKGRLRPPPPRRGEDGTGAKLTWGDVEAIRSRPGPLAPLASRFGVNITTISRILQGKTWVTPPVRWLAETGRITEMSD
jgi:hypothetical protein